VWRAGMAAPVLLLAVTMVDEGRAVAVVQEGRLGAGHQQNVDFSSVLARSRCHRRSTTGLHSGSWRLPPSTGSGSSRRSAERSHLD